MTADQISKIRSAAAQGISQKEVCVLLGISVQEFRSSEDATNAYTQGRLSKKIQRIAKRQRGPTTSADRHHALTSQHSLVDRREPVDAERRARLEQDPRAWLRYYLAETYTRPFEHPHDEMIANALKASETGGRFAVAAERGIGKSVILWGLVLYMALSGRQSFPVCVPWASSAMKRAFRFWKNALCFNQRLAEDYPEITAPFAHSKGQAQKIIATRWRDTGEPTNARLAIGEGLIVFPDGRGCMGGSTINGNIRGLNHPKPDGTVGRPSLVMLDDVQDRSVAKSPDMVVKTCELIDGDVAGCGQAGRDLPMLMACNCIQADDVSEHYLRSAEWTSLRIPCVLSWPDGWDEQSSKAREHWKEWYHRFQNDEDAVAYYKDNREEMIAGMELSAPSIFDGGTVPDAYYGVMLNYHRMGHDAFMAERQQEPIDPLKDGGPYHLTPERILRCVDERDRFARPDWATRIIASTDVNPSYGLSTVVLAFGSDQTCAVIWYGIHATDIQGKKPKPQDMNRLYAEMAKHGRQLADMPCPPDEWVIDGGGNNFDTVLKFAQSSSRSCGLPAMTYTGRNSKYYRPNSRKMDGEPKEQCHRMLDRKDGRQILWVNWNADYWKEVAQRAWLGEIGQPGTASLHRGNHAEFAKQVCAEKLVGKGELGGDMIWNWHTQPGKHDFGDCMAQGFAAAAFYGIGTGGKLQKKRRRPRRIAGR